METEKLTLANIALGQHLDKQLLKSLYKLIFGGVAWPGTNPGFAVIVGMSHEKHFDNYNIYIIDEFESKDTRELVRQCGVFDDIYRPERWVGDRQNNAADKFIREMNREIQQVIDQAESHFSLTDKRLFGLTLTQILEMQSPYSYIVPELRNLLHKDRKQLFLKEGKAASYFLSIEDKPLVDFKFGDYPAIEALAFAVIALRQSSKFVEIEAWRSPHGYDHRPDGERLARSYGINTAL